MHDRTKQIIERKFQFKFRKLDLFWYIYGVVFTAWNVVLLIDSIKDGDVAGIILSALLMFLVITLTIFMLYLGQRNAFYREKHSDLTDAIIDELVQTIEALKAENLILEQKLAKKPRVRKVQ